MTSSFSHDAKTLIEGSEIDKEMDKNWELNSQSVSIDADHGGDSILSQKTTVRHMFYKSETENLYEKKLKEVCVVLINLYISIKLLNSNFENDQQYKNT